jgi:hypothetical protein
MPGFGTNRAIGGTEQVKGLGQPNGLAIHGALQRAR